jgi:sulfonate transport system substrate-binding protein
VSGVRRVVLARVVGCVAGLAFALVFAAAAVPASAGATTIRLGAQLDGMHALMSASGALQGASYTIDWSTFTSGPTQVQALQAGKIDLAGVGNTPVLFGAASRANFRIVAALRGGNHRGDFLLVRSGSSAHHIPDLRGKKVAYTRGSSAHGFLIQALARSGLKPSDVQLVDLSPGDALAAFSSGRVDAWATWEPFRTIALSLTPGGVRTLPTKDDYPASGTSFVLASNTALADRAKRAAISDYLARWRRALVWGLAHPEAWLKAAQEESHLPAAVLRDAKIYTSIELGPVTAAVAGAEQTLADVLARAGVIGAVRVAPLVSNLLR